MRRGHPILLAVCLGAAFAPRPLLAQYAYDAYLDWHGWARRIPGAAAGLASSYDRTGWNNDWNWYQSPAGFVDWPTTVTLATIQGPGVLYRAWMPHQTAQQRFATRFYFDGEPTPRIDTTSDRLLTGRVDYLEWPLVDTCAGGQFCYDPIPFTTELRIESDVQQIPPGNPYADNRHYYQFSYTTFPLGTPILTYTGELDEWQQAERSALSQMIVSAGEHPAGENPNAINLSTSPAALPAGGLLVLANLVGPGTVRRVCVLPASLDNASLDGARLRVWLDNALSAAIDVPLSEFFGAGHARASYRGLPLGTNSADGFYCYWPMPFRSAIRIELVAPPAQPLELASARVEYEPGPIGQQACYLHATRTVTVQDGQQTCHSLLSASGRGHYVGNLLYTQSPTNSFSMLEADELIAIDGVWRINGTGTEDAYNGGYYYNWVRTVDGEPEGERPRSATRALSGVLFVDRNGNNNTARADQYRWMIADRVPFEQSINACMEFQYYYAGVGTRWTSVAFWYQQPALRGDLDDDGDVDADDAAIFCAALLGRNGPAFVASRADLDGNGAVDGDDIAQFIAARNEPP